MSQIRTYTNELKSYAIYKYIKANYYIDAKDDSDQWKVAKIISVVKQANKYVINVRFDGFSSRFNEKYKLPTQKIAPFRKYTSGYTGSERKYDRQQITSITQAINMHREKIEKFLKEINIDCDSITQYIRGELYVFVDTLLCIETKVKDREYKQIINFLYFFLKSGLQIIKGGLGFTNQLNEYFKEPMFYLVHPKYAYFLCNLEILDTFTNIIKSSSSSPRHRLFFINEDNQEVMIKKFKKNMEENDMIELCNHIMNLKIGDRNLPWSIRKGAFQLLYLLNINIQFPILDPKDFNQIFELFPFFRKIFSSDLVDIKQLNLIYDLITSTIFQRKLKGINQLKLLLEKTSKLKLQKVFNLIKQKNLIQYIIDANNFNSELFKRSLPIFQFYIKNKAFKAEYIQKIVNLAQNRHESEVRLIYSLIAELAKSLSQTFLDLLYSKILQLKVDGLIIPLLKDFSCNALINLNSTSSYTKTYIQKKINVGEKYEFYGLNQLWLLLQDESQLEAPFINSAVQAFTTLIFVDYFRSQRQKYLTLCFKNIQKLTSYGQSIKVVQQILKVSSPTIVGQIIRAIDKQMNIVELSTSSLNKLISKNINGQKVTLDQSIQNYFTFLEEISIILRKSLNLNNIKMFWKIQNKEPLLNFLKKGKQQQIREKQQKINKFYEKRIENSLLKEIIENIFMNPQLMNNFQNIDLNVFNTIDELILTYYIRQRYIDYNQKNTIKVQKLENLDLGFYYRVILNPNKQKVLELAIKRIVQFNIRIVSQNKSQLDINTKYTLWTQFMQKLLKEIDKNNLIILKIIRCFLESIQGRMKSVNILSTTPVTVNVLLRPNDKIKKITLPRCSSVYRLRIAIGQQFDISNTDFEMKLPNNGNHTTDFNFQQDYSLAVISTPNDSPSVIVTPSKQIHPHIKALQKFKENISENRLQVLYDMLDKVSDEELVILFEILNKLPKLKSLERKFQKLQIIQNDWNFILSGISIRKLYYQISILQNKNLKNVKWVMQFIQKKGFQHMLNIFFKIQESSFSNLFAIRCYSNFITILAQFLKFAAKTSSIIKNQVFFQHTIKLLIASIEKPNQQTSDFINNCFRLINVLIISISSKNFRLFYENKKIKNILEYCFFFKDNNKQFSSIFFDGIKKQIQDPSNRNLILNCLINNFLSTKYLQSQRKNCQNYFNVLIKIIQSISKSEWKEKNNIIVQNIIIFLQNARKLSYLQKSSNDYDALLNGWLSLISIMFKRSNNSIETLLEQKQHIFANYLLNECLFPPKDKSESAKCKSIKNRNEAFRLLQLFQSTKEHSIKEISNLLLPILNKSNWRGPGEWSIAVSDQKNSDFKGLRNLAATCYINSLMQQLFSITEFRQSLLKVQSAGGSQDILFQVQQIFSFLKYSEKATYSPQSFCNTFILQGQPIDPRMQMDADQFFNHLMDKLDRNLKSIKSQFIINNSFQGEISNQIICKDCPHQSQRNQDYLTLGVTIKNKKSLELALKQFIQGELLDGDNAYYCEKCEKKVKCLKRACIKQLPNILIIVLKRFEFDYDAMQKIKLNDYCEFPLKLDMKPYTKEYLKKLQKPNQQNLKPDPYYLYNLKGTVIHYGTSQAGHYYSYIKTGNQNNWYQFNDEVVQKFDLNQLGNQAFGGTHQSQFIENEQKCKNAYILFYQRSKYYINNQQTRYMITPISQSKTTSRAYQIVHQDNLKNQYIRVAFDNSLIEYLNKTITSKENKFLMLYTHLVIFRSKERNNFIFEYFARVQQELIKDSTLCDWYINNISEGFLKQFLIDAPKEVRYIVLYFIYLALKSTKINGEFVKRCINLLNKKNSFIAKIFCLIPNAKQLSKILNDNEFFQRVCKLIIESQNTNKIIQTKSIKSQFGQAIYIQENRKQDFINYDCLIQAMQIYNIKFEDIKKLIPKGRNYKTARNTLAKMISRMVKQKDNFQKFCNSYLAIQLLRGDQQKQMLLCLKVMKQLININDDYTQQRHKRLSDIHLNALKQSLTTYQPFNLLLEALFRFCFSNNNYRNRVLMIFSENKSLIRNIRLWINQTSMNDLIRNLKLGQLSYWRKSTLTNFILNMVGNMQNNEAYYTKKKEERQSRFNGLLQKHNITMQQPLEDIDYQKGQKYQYINNSGKLMSFQVQQKIGYLYLIKIDGNLKWHTIDDELI